MRRKGRQLGALKLKRLAPGYYEHTAFGTRFRVYRDPEERGPAKWNWAAHGGFAENEPHLSKADAAAALEEFLAHPEMFPQHPANKRGLKGLPTRGRIPLATAKRALKNLPKKYRACGITPSLLREGMEIEREHRDVTKGRVGDTAKTAAVHICEHGPRYYPSLKKLERKLKR